MKLVADSGSSKTDWTLGDGEIYQTRGLNPYFYTSEEIYEILKEELPDNVLEKPVTSLFFYGAGCSSDERTLRVKSALEKIFHAAKVSVEHDLLGAARALCGNEKGIACILGTGSNSCLFDGENILEQRGGYGYILSDEGSGSYMGKNLIRHYLYGELPPTIHEDFEKEYGNDKNVFIENIYRQENPNRYLASFAPFLKKHLNHPFMYKLVEHSFDDFFKRHISHFPDFKNLPCHFVGSIAESFDDVLLNVMDNYQVQPGNLVSRPIEKLFSFHDKNQTV